MNSIVAAEWHVVSGNAFELNGGSAQSLQWLKSLLVFISTVSHLEARSSLVESAGCLTRSVTHPCPRTLGAPDLQLEVMKSLEVDPPA